MLMQRAKVDTVGTMWNSTLVYLKIARSDTLESLAI